MALKDERIASVAIIGAGAAGLITAYTLRNDGFSDVRVLTRDTSPGGIWARERVYPGLVINNVHGEFRFSPMEMPPPVNTAKTGGRLTGEDLREYMEVFAEKFLKDAIRYNTEVLNIERNAAADCWLVTVINKRTNIKETLRFSRIVLCTGGCSKPFIPDALSPSAARIAGFSGPVLHSSQFFINIPTFLSTLNQSSSVVIVGGGRSAQDTAAHLAAHPLGLSVSLVFDTADAFLAVSRPLPAFIRKSRFLGILSPHIELRSRLERFFHTTWLGGKIVRFIWDAITRTSFDALKIPKNSPLRRAHSLFWGIRTNDEGVLRPNGFHTLVGKGRIRLVAPGRVAGFADDGRGVVLENGEMLSADAVVLATGYKSSWTELFNDETAAALGIKRHPPLQDDSTYSHEWNYTSLANPPHRHHSSNSNQSEQWSASIYRGLVPAKNIACGDFAINGAVFTTNSGYAYEVSAHWISAYFLRDPLRLPKTSEDALAACARNAAWLRRRFPGMLSWANESHSSGIAFWTWPQATDELLDDMGVESGRSGGNWITWPFKVVDAREIEGLAQERRARRREQLV